MIPPLEKMMESNESLGGAYLQITPSLCLPLHNLAEIKKGSSKIMFSHA